MGMLSNGPSCHMKGTDKANRPCFGNLHQYAARMTAMPDGTPVQDAATMKIYVCEGHFPDPTDPKFLTCACELCKLRISAN